MAPPAGFGPQFIPRVAAGVLSAAVHIAIILAALFAGNRFDGVGESETSFTQLVLLEAQDADRREGVDLTPIEPIFDPVRTVEQSYLMLEPPSITTDESAPRSPEASLEQPDEPTAVAIAAETAPDAPMTFVMSSAEQSELSQRLARLAEEFAKQPHSEVSWREGEARYSAVLVQERANDGTALDRVVAEVSASDRGKHWSTRVMLKRLAFSQFGQMVDRWDPMVQLHDDVIVGRFHSNSRFNVLRDSGATPSFLGKVTTAARTFDMHAGGRRHEEIFRGGVETGAGKIPLPENLQPSHWAPPEANARVHELTEDTHIRFFADGSYMWRTRGASASNYLNAPSEHPIYFIGARSASLYVRGVVAGKVLIYSPQKIVIEGSLTYAADPRTVPDSGDYLGLVSDKYIEVASPSVTGRGDLDIHAAIFARRRFVVRDIDHGRSATLRIFGSLAAGSLSASEPRYATHIVYDERFEERRPPGFPSTDRYEVDNWNGEWVEAVESGAHETVAEEG